MTLDVSLNLEIGLTDSYIYNILIENKELKTVPLILQSFERKELKGKLCFSHFRTVLNL